jgi:hypothetical protein
MKSTIYLLFSLIVIGGLGRQGNVSFAQVPEYPQTAVKIVGQVGLAFLQFDLFVQGSYAYAVAGNNRTQNQLIVIDIS